MTTKELREKVDSYKELLYAQQLNLELLETLELTLISVKDFCKKHDIPIGNEKINSLLSRINLLLDELDVSDGISQKKLPDDNFPVPVSALYKGAIVSREH